MNEPKRKETTTCSRCVWWQHHLITSRRLRTLTNKSLGTAPQQQLGESQNKMLNQIASDELKFAKPSQMINKREI